MGNRDRLGGIRSVGIVGYDMEEFFRTEAYVCHWYAKIDVSDGGGFVFRTLMVWCLN